MQAMTERQREIMKLNKTPEIYTSYCDYISSRRGSLETEREGLAVAKFVKSDGILVGLVAY